MAKTGKLATTNQYKSRIIAELLAAVEREPRTKSYWAGSDSFVSRVILRAGKLYLRRDFPTQETSSSETFLMSYALMNIGHSIYTVNDNTPSLFERERL